MQHLPGGDAVDDHGLRVGRVHAVRDLDKVAGGHQRVTGPATGLGQRGDPAADKGAVAAGPDGGHDADEVVTRHERELRLARIAVTPHAPLGEGDAAGFDPDEGLSGAGRWERALPQLKSGRLDDSGKHDFGRGDAGLAGGSLADLLGRLLLIAIT